MAQKTLKKKVDPRGLKIYRSKLPKDVYEILIDVQKEKEKQSPEQNGLSLESIIYMMIRKYKPA